VNENLRPVAIHEAGHSYMAWRTGRRVGPVTIRPGTVAAGVSHFDPPQLTSRERERLDLQAPYLLWPAAVRHKIDTDAMVTAAGHEAERTLRRTTAARRVGDTAAEAAAQIAAAKPPTRNEERLLALSRAAADPRSDDEHLAALMRLVAPTDIATGTAWLNHITAQARAVLRAGAPAVYRLTEALLEHKDLSGRAVCAILRPAP
jgi:hypothetical protein